MKNFFIFLLLLLCTTAMQAQVKIGDNPNTIGANSMLELESTNKGLVIPRMALNNETSVSPLSTPVIVSTLVYSTGGTLPDGYYYWDGAKWVRLVTSTVARNNYVLVKAASDFPAPVGGIITLAANTIYEVNGTIVLTSKINLNGSWITGMDAVNDKLVYTPTSGELFTGNSGGNIRTLTLVASGVGAKLFNLDAANAAKNLIVQNCYFLSCDNLGTIKGFGGTVYFNTIAMFYNTNGITFDSDYNVVMNTLLWDVTNKNTFEKYVGAFNIIQKVGGDVLTSSANTAIGMDISGITSLVAGELKTVLFTGTGTYISGSFSTKWEVECAGLNTEKDGVAGGNLYMATPVATTFTASGTPTKVLGTTTSVGLFRMTSPTNNRLTYTGSKTRSFQVMCSLSAFQPSSNRYFSFYIAKNGVVLPESRQEVKIINSTDQVAIPLSCMVTLAPNDYVEVWVENETTTSSVTVQTLNLSLK